MKENFEVLDRKLFKNRISSTMRNLNIITHCNVSWDDDRDVIGIRHERAYCPDFELKYSQQYNVYHVYILTKSRDTEEKQRSGYTIMVVDSGLAATELCTAIQMFYRRRPGQRV